MEPSQPSTTYTPIRELGRGAFGAVVLCKRSDTGADVAIKKIDRGFLNKYVADEIVNHSKLDHPHVVQFREVFLSPKHINIVMEYANGGSLFAFVKEKRRLSEDIARWFFQQLMFAVDYCHKKSVAVRDIKLENTLLHYKNGKSPLVKVCDFGYAKDMKSGSLAASRVGTMVYMAPEVLHGRPYSSRVVDIWACGVVLYIMLVGRYPFNSDTDDANNPHAAMAVVQQLLQKMESRELWLPEVLTQECRELVLGLLEPDPSKRLSMEQIIAHPWFQKGLPKDALTMNDKYLASPRQCKQSPEDIRTIVEAALRQVASEHQHDAEEFTDAVMQQGGE